MHLFVGTQRQNPKLGDSKFLKDATKFLDRGSRTSMISTLRFGKAALAAGTSRSLSSGTLLQGYGEHLFKGAVADKYLCKVGLPMGTIEDGAWIKDPATADKVAAGILDWATDNGASVYCHWFQPLASSGVRHGLSGQVQNSFFKFDEITGQPIWNLKGKDLLTGETDGSSYPNGGLRATHKAGGYLTIDPTSPIWLRGDTIFIPSAFASYYGHALDEKLPLMRAVDAMSEQGTRLLKLLGFPVEGLVSNIGLEQELFLVDREAYLKRPDLQLTGRTVIGRDAPRGQEMCDHYMAPPSLCSPALGCMQEIQEQCFRMGIPLRTRHREVAPGQYEFAPLYGTVTAQVDQNVIVMQVIEEVAAQHGLAALLQEKPFSNVNGSGKHNNWSIATTCGTNLLHVEQVARRSGSDDIFPVIMAALLSAVGKHGDLMRMSIASPGNDFRLGACEAPPAIVSAYLGEDVTAYLNGYKNGSRDKYKPASHNLDLGLACLPPLEVPAEDRNRTSPFAYGGHRFEFRAVGSAQNVSLVNTVLNAMAADAFREFADAIEAGRQPQEVAAAAFDAHEKVIFNGNNYDPAEQQMLTDRGLWRIDSCVDAIARFTHPKNIELFTSLNVMDADECAARQAVMYDHYVGTVEIEAQCMIDMLHQHIIPAVKQAGVGPLKELVESAIRIKNELDEVKAVPEARSRTEAARSLRLESMVEVREICDAAEAVVPANLWPLGTYQELLFMQP